MSNNRILSKEIYLLIIAEKILRQNLSKKDGVDHFLKPYQQNPFFFKSSRINFKWTRKSITKGALVNSMETN